MSVLLLRNRQKTRHLDLKLLRAITRSLLEQSLGERAYELGLQLVGATAMAKVNETYLQHSGSTDVITFDYSAEGPAESTKAILHGEIFICIDDAVVQAREFGTTWQEELIRYVVHGILHLQGYDDLKPQLRRIMKKEENRLVNELSTRFPLRKLSRLSKKAP